MEYPKASISLNIPSTNIQTYSNKTEVDISSICDYIQSHNLTPPAPLKPQQRSTLTNQFLDQFTSIIQSAIHQHITTNDDEREEEVAVLRNDLLKALKNHQYNISYFNKVAGSYILVTPRNAKKYFFGDSHSQVKQEEIKLIVNFRSKVSRCMPSVSSIAGSSGSFSHWKGSAVFDGVSYNPPLKQAQQVQQPTLIDQEERLPQKDSSRSISSSIPRVEQQQKPRKVRKSGSSSSSSASRNNKTSSSSRKTPSQSQPQAQELQQYWNEAKEEEKIPPSHPQTQAQNSDRKTSAKVVKHKKVHYYSKDEEDSTSPHSFASNDDNISETKRAYKEEETQAQTQAQQQKNGRNASAKVGKHKKVLYYSKNAEEDSTSQNSFASSEEDISEIKRVYRTQVVKHVIHDTHTPKEQYDVYKTNQDDDNEDETITSSMVKKPHPPHKNKTNQAEYQHLPAVERNQPMKIKSSQPSDMRRLQSSQRQPSDESLSTPKDHTTLRELNAIPRVQAKQSSIPPNTHAFQTSSTLDPIIPSTDCISASTTFSSANNNEYETESYSSSVCFKVSSIQSGSSSYYITSSLYQSDDECIRSTIPVDSLFSLDKSDGMGCDTIFLYAIDAALLHVVKLWGTDNEVALEERLVGCQSNHSFGMDIAFKFSNRGLSTCIIHNQPTSSHSVLDGGALIVDEYTSPTDVINKHILDCVVQGGYILLFVTDTRLSEDSTDFSFYQLSHQEWDISHPVVIYSEDDITLYCIQKRPCALSNDICTGKYHSKARREDLIEKEYNILKQVTITRPARDFIAQNEERNSGFSLNTLKRANYALETFGFCIVKQFMKEQDCLTTGHAARIDCKEGISLLHDKFQKDIMYNYNTPTTASEEIPAVIEYPDITFYPPISKVELKDGRRIRHVKQLWNEHLIQKKLPILEPLLSQTFQSPPANYNIQNVNFKLFLSNKNDDAIQYNKSQHLYPRDDIPPQSMCLHVQTSPEPSSGIACVATSHLYSNYKKFAASDRKDGKGWNKHTCSHVVRPLLAPGDAFLYNCRLMTIGCASNDSKSLNDMDCMLQVQWLQDWFVNSLKKEKKLYYKDLFLFKDCLYYPITTIIRQFLLQQWSSKDESNDDLPLSRRLLGWNMSSANTSKMQENDTATTTTILVNEFLQSISSTGIQTELYTTAGDGNISPRNFYDAMAIFHLKQNIHPRKNIQEWKMVQDSIVPGGFLFLFLDSSTLAPPSPPSDISKEFIFSPYVWTDLVQLYKECDFVVYYTCKRSCSINYTPCRRWKPQDLLLGSEYIVTSTSIISPHLSHECTILNEVTITSPACNYRLQPYDNNDNPNELSSSLSPLQILKAVNAMHTYGFCILRNFVSSSYVESLNHASFDDSAMHGRESFVVSNNTKESTYYDHRVDLSGPNIQHALGGDGENTWIRKNESLNCIIYNIMFPIQKMKRQQLAQQSESNIFADFQLEDIHSIPPSSDSNFDVKADDHVRVSVTFPDCSGEDFYSITNHLHDGFPYHVPPHYLRLLLPSAPSNKTTPQRKYKKKNSYDDSIPLGNAFCAGSHHQEPFSSNSEEDIQKRKTEMFYNIVRPTNLTAGDAILLDGRMLHVDLPNMSEDATSVNTIWNPMIYFDWKRNWFSD